MPRSAFAKQNYEIVATYALYISTKSQRQRANEPRMVSVELQNNSCLISKLVENEQTFAVFSMVPGPFGTKLPILVQLC